MSLRGRNQSQKEIELEEIIVFLHTLLSMAAGIAAVAAGGMFLAKIAGQTTIIYEMTLAVNIMMLVAGRFALAGLKRRMEKQKEDCRE